MDAHQTEALVIATQRIATALEQIALELVKPKVAQVPAANLSGFSTPASPSADVPWPAEPPAPDEPLPPVNPAFVFKPVTECPVHHQPWRQVPAGVSKRTGQPYAAFLACPVRDCNQKAPA